MQQRALLLLTISAALLAVAAVPATQPVNRWAGVRHFAIQLQKTDLTKLAASRFEMLIIDPAHEAHDGVARLTAAEIDIIRRGQQNPPVLKCVIAYLSVGQAASYREYWQKDWTAHPPDWMGPEDPNWKGSFHVKFWGPAWERLLFSDLDLIIDAGFDGAMLDVVDAGEFWADRTRGNARRATAERDMADLVIRLATHARRRKPGFALLPNGGLTLLRFGDYLDTVDALVREDVWYNADRLNKPADTAYVLDHIAPLLAVGKPAFVIDYVSKPKLVDDFYVKARAAGVVPYASVRNLDRLVVNANHDP